MQTRFDEDKATHACSFFEELLVHTKGAYARQKFHLAAFQRTEIIRPMFGTQMLDADSEEWVRLYNLAWIELGRGNGKSEILAGIALYLTGADDEEGAEVYGVAKDTDQASLVFNVARRMLELSGLGGAPRENLPFVIYPTNKRIVYPKLGSFYRVIPGDALGNLGQDPHGIVFDEIIAQPNGELWDALKTGFKRRQPLMVAATTAGDDPTSFAQTEHDFHERVLADPSIAPRRLVFMRNAPKDCDPGDEEAWKAANPALGDFLRTQIIRDEYHEAFGPGGNLRARRAFHQFRLNQWQEASLDSPIPLDDWDASAGMVNELALKGRVAYGGLVTAYIEDLTCVCWTFPPKKPALDYQALWRFYIPEDALASLVDRTDGAAEQWVKDGHLKLTEGNVVDVAEWLRVLRADLARFDVRELAFDQSGALGILQPLQLDGVEVVKISGQSGGGALLDWARLVAERHYLHSANPVMRWQIACLMARQGADDVAKIDRKGSRDVVPGAVAAEFALRRALVAPEKRPGRIASGG